MPARVMAISSDGAWSINSAFGQEAVQVPHWIHTRIPSPPGMEAISSANVPLLIFASILFLFTIVPILFRSSTLYTTFQIKKKGLKVPFLPFTCRILVLYLQANAKLTISPVKDKILSGNTVRRFYPLFNIVSEFLQVHQQKNSKKVKNE